MLASDCQTPDKVIVSGYTIGCVTCQDCDFWLHCLRAYPLDPLPKSKFTARPGVSGGAPRVGLSQYTDASKWKVGRFFSGCRGRLALAQTRGTRGPEIRGGPSADISFRFCAKLAGSISYVVGKPKV